MRLGGMSPLPAPLGGGKPRVKAVLEGLNADRGTAYDATNSETYVYAHNMALARAISAAWGTNERLARLWVPESMSMDVLERWEKIMAIYPAPDDSNEVRRARVGRLLARFGRAIVADEIEERLTQELGDVFVQVDHISYANAYITVPDGTYPWGSVDTTRPWSSTMAHVLIRLQKPTGYSEVDFYEAAGRVTQILDPILPAWAYATWYRPGPVSQNISGGPSAGGFYLDDAHNLDNEVFA